MSTNESRPEPDRDGSDPANVIEPLEGEAGIPSVVRSKGVNVSRKGIFAVALLALSLVAVSGVSINRALSSKKDGDEVSKRLGDWTYPDLTDTLGLDLHFAAEVNSAVAGMAALALLCISFSKLMGDF